MTSRNSSTLVSVERIAQSILILRGHKVLLDTHLAALYGVPTGVLVQAVKRNLERFPQDFMFQLTAVEWSALRSQFVISNDAVRPIDKAANAEGLRRPLDPLTNPPAAMPAAGIAPLLKQMIADYAATGLPPAYLPTQEKDPP